MVKKTRAENLNNLQKIVFVSNITNKLLNQNQLQDTKNTNVHN